MYYPTLNPIAQSRLITETFGGYNHNLKIYGGEWYDETNLSSSYYPLFSQREKRGTVSTLTSPQGMIAKDALMYVDGASLVYNGSAVSGVTLSTAAGMIPKQIVSMGAYAVVFPDKVFVNTKDLTDYGTLDATFTTATGADVTYTMCRVDGTAYDLETAVVAAVEPPTPANGQYWIDTSAAVHVLRQYSTTTSLWTAIPTVYVKIGYAEIGTNFAQYDGITLSGCAGPVDNVALAAQITALNTSNVIQAVGTDYIVITGIIDQAYTQATGAVTVARTSPAMDYVTECDNRLWGCKYGIVDGEAVNEIYACALGDFKNWNRYMGISTDSYAVSVGTDGKFTGAITFLGYPLFFKETCIHKVYGSIPSNYNLQTTICRGVQEGSEKSLAIVAETLYYKSRMDVCAYDGSLPQSVSAQFGTQTFTDAVGGSFETKYYISMKDSAASWHLFVFDTARGIWHREDATQVMAFANVRGDFLFIDAATKKLHSATGKTGTLETSVTWSATSGIMGYEYPDAKYLSRFNIRAKLGNGATLTLEVEYDSGSTWTNCGTYTGNALTGTIMIPVVPRRCDHLRLRFSGTGDVKVYSIARIIEQGGDG